MGSQDALINVDEIEDPIVRRAFRYFCRHLVAITGTYVPLDIKGSPAGEPRRFAYSGFVVELRGTWMIATAGHIIQDFESKLDRIRLGQCNIVDCFGPGEVSNYAIPFDLAGTERFYVHEDDSQLRLDENLGLDLGLIQLDENNVKLLQANNVVPVSEENMRTAGNSERSWHMIVGFPECVQDKALTDRQAFRLSPVLVRVTELRSPPDDLATTRFPRFVGQLPERSTIDIQGMSGGPIIGFSADQTKYWVVAIQSTWLPKRKITFGCPTSVFLALVDQLLGDTSA